MLWSAETDEVKNVRLFERAVPSMAPECRALRDAPACTGA